MDEYEMKRRIYGYIKEICHYSQMQVFATSYYQKNYFQMQIDDATDALISLYMDLWKTSEQRGQKRRYRNQELQNQPEQEVQADEQLLIIETLNPMTGVQVPPTGTPIPPTGSPIPQTGSQVPPTGSQVTPTGTQVPQTGSQVPTTGSQVPPTGSPIPQTGVQVPPTEPQMPQSELREFTVEELAEFNGKDGKPAYVAVNGTVYDVSSLTRWAGGNHFGMIAGRDLSGPFLGCHQGIMDRLNKAVIVGTLEKGV